MNTHTVKDYLKAMMHGSKYVYQAIPRILTLWLDGGENPKIASHAFYAKINSGVSTAIDSIPVYKARYIPFKNGAIFNLPPVVYCVPADCFTRWTRQCESVPHLVETYK